MNRRNSRKADAAVVCFAVVVDLSCSSPSERATNSRGTDDACVFGSVGPVEVDAVRVRATRAMLIPAPTRAESIRLTFDVLTAEWIVHGTIGALDPTTGVASYRTYMNGRLARGSAASVVEELRDARASVGEVRLPVSQVCVEAL